ncbi:SDR family NAD(P)-dependent oxidoreductase [Amylibacter sp.]|nr:SDR family NAD(P)-dependent oxidoreductase [Amylibacter sp.]
MEILKILGRKHQYFLQDMNHYKNELQQTICGARILVVGGAGSVGQAVAKLLFRFDPRVLHVVDVSENNLVELVRQIRSTDGYGSGDFRTFTCDVTSSSIEDIFSLYGPYDYVLNFSAMKHVRSEKDPISLKRMIDVNIFAAVKILKLASHAGAKKYFSISTDKAAAPHNFMGASKRVMEYGLIDRSDEVPISMARFANVAFSDGSLPHGFKNRLNTLQPISAPKNIRRYFITAEEAARLCLLSTFISGNRTIVIPSENLKLVETSFTEIASRYLASNGYEVLECSSEEEARIRIKEARTTKKWPCYFFESDTTGEKELEEFVAKNECIDNSSYKEISEITLSNAKRPKVLQEFFEQYNKYVNNKVNDRQKLYEIFANVVTDFDYADLGHNLEKKM